MNFNLQDWIELAKTDPDNFELERQKLLQTFIEQSSNQRKLNGLQFKINMEREKAKNPMDSCIRLSKMLNEHFYSEFYPRLGGLSELKIPNFKAGVKYQNEEKIIPFKPK